MKTEEILGYILPQEVSEYFELTSIVEVGEKLELSLDENRVKPPEHEDKPLESKGFAEAVYIYDFPIRDKGVVLKIRRRKWKDKQTGSVYQRDWDLKASGTSYTKDFALFLKKMVRYQTH